MEIDLRLKINEYFSLSIPDREQLITDLVHFYFTRNVSVRNDDEFEVSIGQLLFNLEMEHNFAVKSEAYNRAEIYSKLCKIFHQIRDEYYNTMEENNGL